MQYGTLAAAVVSALLTLLPSDAAAASTCASPAFGTPRQFEVSDASATPGLASGDFNADGHADLAVLAYTVPDAASTLRVLFGDGSGAFSPRR